MSNPEPILLRPRVELIPHGLGWRYVHHEYQATLTFSRLKDGDEPSAEVTVSTTLPGVTAHLTRERVRLLGNRSKGDLVKKLGAVCDAILAWDVIVEDACDRVVTALRKGEPIETLEEPTEPLEVAWLVERMLMEGQLNTIYGPGGYGKGYLAVACAVAVQTGTPLAGLSSQQGNVLYLDWEDTKQECNKRVAEICRGYGRPFVRFAYRHCRTPFAEMIENVADYCTEHGVRLVIVDSFQAAAGSMGEHGGYEDSARRVLEAARCLVGITILFIDHVSGEGVRQGKLVGKQIGAIIKQNQIRNNLEVRKDQEYGAAWHLGLYDAKGNKGAKRPPLGFRLDFGAVPGALRITRRDVRDSVVLAEGLSLAYRIDGVMQQHGAVSYSVLYSELEGEKQDTIRRTIKRGLDAKRYVEPKPGFYGLAQR